MNCISRRCITGNPAVEPTPAQLRKRQLLEAMRRRQSDGLYGYIPKLQREPSSDKHK